MNCLVNDVKGGTLYRKYEYPQRIQNRITQTAVKGAMEQWF